MKKILKSFLFLLVGISLLPSMNVSASNYTDSFNDKAQWIPNTYVTKEKGSVKKFQQLTVIKRKSDGQFVYCIEPGTPLDPNEYYHGQDYDQSYVSSMTNEQWRRISLLAYYGYGYGNHTDLKWYSVTQFLIWQVVPHGYDIYFTDSLNGNRISKYVDEINELNRLVSEHYKTPSFINNNIEMNIGESINLNDENGVLNKFVISQQDKINATINNNNLTITANSVGEGSITLTKKDTNYSHPAIVYVHPSSQDVIVRGSYDPTNVNIKINITGGKVSVKKIDMDTGLGIAQGDASLNGAIYGIYKDDGTRVGEVKSIGGEYVTSDFLPSLGTFYLLEEKASLGYELSETKYYFEITKDNLYPKVDVTEKVIERKLEIFKVFASDQTGFLTGEPNIQFDIYLKSTNKKVASIITDEKGYATATLPYGVYVVKQINSSENFEKVDDFEITINEDTENPIYKLLSNSEIVAKLKVIKVDSETGKIIARSNIKFKIFNVTTGEYVSQTITYPTAQTIDVFETDKNGILITPYPLKSGKYRLEEVDQAIDGYLWNSKSVEFEIGENSELITDNKYGIIFETKFENKPVKGEVEINKVGEKLVVENGTYNYEEIKLDGVTYELYANEDIYSADGTLIFKNKELVGTYKTKDGYFKISNLYLGKYCLIETATANNHVIDSTKHCFELKYKDQYTPIVSLDFTFKNYLEKGTIDFTKTDLAGNPLPNTKIQIFTNNDGEENVLVFEGVTDENGKIIIDNLFVGKFKLIESEAPDGYILNPNPQEFEIKENGEIIKATMTNEQIVEVPNTGISDSKVLDVVGIVLIIAGVGYIVIDKKGKNKSHAIIIGSFLILLGIVIPCYKYLHESYLNHSEEEKVEEFLEQPIIETPDESNTIDIPKKEESKPKVSYNYIAVLEIPSISLKRGLVDKNDRANNVNQNIQILKDSDMPNVTLGNFILASHSGTGRIAFFKNLHHIKLGDHIFVYYNNIKYIYKVVNTYSEPKDGDIVIHRNNGKTTLTLTTCSQTNKGNQFVVISELIKKESY